MCFDETEALENCQNIQDSKGELCVGCNKCGRFNNQHNKVEED